ncbi:hypothetical protein BpHYR1_022368 [Brachionus plicatilis]|uniref:Uncharacterized protein n=1 Tax=Brachionus plicatilis TaxID=10195 RepID=A0A3M7PPX2_BRAPC|nr:hypothetical protein BpHYR1_022368 [Brachionus plicatilis]
MPRSHSTCPFLKSLPSDPPSNPVKLLMFGTSLPISIFFGSERVGIELPVPIGECRLQKEYNTPIVLK